MDGGLRGYNIMNREIDAKYGDIERLVWNVFSRRGKEIGLEIALTEVFVSVL